MSHSTATPQVTRSNSGSTHSTATPQVTRSNSGSTRSNATPQVTRGNSGSTRSDATPQVTRGNSGSTRSNDSGTRFDRGATTRGGNDKGSTTTPSTRRTDSAIGNVDKTKTDRTGSVGTSTTQVRPNGTIPSGNTKPNVTPDKPNGKPDVIDRPDGKPNGKPNGRPNGKPDGKPNGRPNGNNGHPGGGNGYNPDHRYDYTNHHYRSEFEWNYYNHNWGRPLPPPARPYRPAPFVWYRPVIPAGWSPLAGAPIIDRILGITFGTLFDSSLDYLYFNGYEIDGYADNIIYLRDVPLLSCLWNDVMLCYDSSNRLINAQFVYQTSRYSRVRYDRIYRSLCRLYGYPFTNDHGTLSWYGGDRTGWVTLSINSNLGHCYTTLSIGY